MIHKPTLKKQTKPHPVKGQVIARNEPKMHAAGKGEPKAGKQKAMVKKGRRG
jgi:hypothetical protein